MDYLKTFPALDGLVDLANRDVDISPTLLRVLTDLYVTKPAHTREEERQYTELVLRLLDVVDVSARHHLAQRLANYAQTPQAVARRLVRDVIAVAGPILRDTRSLSDQELMTTAQKISASHVAAVLARQNPAAAATSRADGRNFAPSASQAAAAKGLTELFFSANATERRLILLNLDYAPFAPATPIAAPLASDTVRRLEAAALSHQIETFMRELTRALAIAPSIARQIAEDPTGEPIVAAATMLAMPADVLQRILLCLNPAISQSVQKVYDLADLFVELDPASALRMLAIWRASGEASKPIAKAAVHQPQHADVEGLQRPDAGAPRRTMTPHMPDQRTGTKRS